MMARPIGVLAAGRPELSGANSQFPHLPLGGGPRVIPRSPPSRLVRAKPSNRPTTNCIAEALLPT
jgi:hypothetical protein